MIDLGGQLSNNQFEINIDSRDKTEMSGEKPDTVKLIDQDEKFMKSPKLVDQKEQL